jgi:hypothetical protein
MASGADAYPSDKRTYFTFSQSVALPGVTLPAGTYMFRLADPNTGRRVIQVSDAKGTESYAMLLTMPAYRTRPANDPEIRFLETPVGAPRAVDAWWYVGDSAGYQFIYSKRQLAELNRTPAPEPVAAFPESAPGAEANAGEPVEVPPLEEPVVSPGVVNGEGLPPAEAEAEAGVDLEADAQLQAQAQQPAPVSPEPAPPQSSAADRDALPQTASPLGILLLTGLGTGVIGLRLMRKS